MIQLLVIHLELDTWVPSQRFSSQRLLFSSSSKLDSKDSQFVKQITGRGPYVMVSAGVGEHVVMPLDPLIDDPLVPVHHWAAQVLHPLIHQALATIIIKASDDNYFK